MNKYSIASLWAAGNLPACDGLYFADGRSFHFRIDAFPAPTIRLGRQFDLIHLLRNHPDDLTCYDILFGLKLFDRGWIYTGEASHGSEGFFAFLNSSEDLIWVMYNEESNPYIKAVEYPRGQVKISSSAGFSLILDVTDPMSACLSAA